ncbi:G8 domain-containing protein [Verrucomicrobiota bacterium sgz303538]
MKTILLFCAAIGFLAASTRCEVSDSEPLRFDVRSVRNGAWSDPQTWEPAQVPGQGQRVLVSSNTRVIYDRESDAVIRLIQVAGELSFSRDRSTTLNVGLLKVQNSEHCSENGFRCDLHAMTDDGEPNAQPVGASAALEVGTFDKPIPAQFTARIRLHYLDGMNKDDAPALSACSARMDLHGAPMSRTWVKLGADANQNGTTVTLAEPVTGWRVGDEVIVTGSIHGEHLRTYREGQKNSSAPQTEERIITRIEGTTLTLDRPLVNQHFGSGDLRSEVANLSRNVIIESADPNGVRGHTLYHQFSTGGISYARFAHLGKEGVLGRYPIHFHLVEDTMRGSGVIGAAIVDSHNRWVTIHGTQYLLVRDCVGYRGVGHGFFMEDGTEVFNLLDRNLGVQAFRGKPLPKQVLRFDPNEGAAFWWANGRNSLTRNVSCENDEYGFRYDSQSTRSFSSRIAVRTPEGREEKVDIRTLPFYRFEANEAHTEGLYGMVFAGNNQRGDPITKVEDLATIDRTGPDTRHPHIVRDAKIWQVHYGLRPQIPDMLLERVHIAHATYGIYRPALENHVYRDLTIANVTSEPFNRGMDDASTQFGRLTVDGLTFMRFPYDRHIPLIQISDNNPTGAAESHFRNVRLLERKDGSRRALVDRGGGARTAPITEAGVPVYLHDYYGPGRTAKVASTSATALTNDGHAWRKETPLTGDDSVVTEVTDVPFPQLLNPVDDLAPATIITSARLQDGKVVVTGISHDNGDIAAVVVNGREAKITSLNAGVADWQITLDDTDSGKVVAFAKDKAGNTEQTPDERTVGGTRVRVAGK